MSWRIENEGASRRVVITKDLPGERWRHVLRNSDCELHIGTSRDVLSVADLRQAIGDRCHAVIGQLTETWGSELFEALRAAGGRVYSNYAVGYDNVDVAEATRCAIPVGNTPGVLTETTAEMAVALTWAAARRVPESDAWVRRGEWKGWLPDLFLGKRLHGQQLGVVGAGRIGQAYALALGPGSHMRLRYTARSPKPDFEARYETMAEAFRGAPREPQCRYTESLDELLETCDVVSLHCPLNDTTRHLIGTEQLARMKSDAILVNTARGAVIDEAALVVHLRENREFRAGLDVFEHEPELEAGLAELPNAVVVPHLGSATSWTREGMATLAACNVAALLEGWPVAKHLRVEEYLRGEIPETAPSIVNAETLGLAHS